MNSFMLHKSAVKNNLKVWQIIMKYAEFISPKKNPTSKQTQKSSEFPYLLDLCKGRLKYFLDNHWYDCVAVHSSIDTHVKTYPKYIHKDPTSKGTQKYLEYALICLISVRKYCSKISQGMANYYGL